MAPDRHPGCPGAPPENVRGAFNAHSPGDGGSGLVQPVFRSPARIPPAESSRRGLCAAPPSEKRYTLSRPSGELRTAPYCSTKTNARRADRVLMDVVLNRFAVVL